MALLLAGVLCLPALAGPGVVCEDDPGVKRYALKNGLGVVVVPDEGRGDVQMWLILDSGTMDEGDGTRGIAQVVSAMARSGIGGYDEDAIETMLLSAEERAQEPRRSTGVQVLFDHTVLRGRASAGDAGAMEDLLGYYRALLTPANWEADAERFERARSWLLGRIEGALDPPMVARQRWMSRLLGEGTLGTRLDLPEPAEVESLVAEDGVRFASRCYRSNHATLLVVGDVSGVGLEALIAETLGQPEPGPGVSRPDARAGLGGERVIFEQEPGWDEHQGVLVWSDELGPPAQSVEGVRSFIIKRVAQDLIRRRIERLAVASFGGESEITVNQFELGGRVELMQWVVQREGTDERSWNETVALLLREGERLARHGAGREEIVQARGSLLARWHRDAESWRTTGTRQRARSYVMLAITGRRMMSPERWDHLATALMSTIRDEEIDAAVRRLGDPGGARLLLSSGGEGADTRARESSLRVRRDEISGAQIDPLDGAWMRELGGTLISPDRVLAEPARVTQHAPSGTWGASMPNGVRLWARSAGQEERFDLSVMLWGTIFGDGSLSEGEIRAAMLAWEHPATEERDAGWMAVYLKDHGLELSARRVVGGVRLRVRGPAGALRAGSELISELLARPMIDANAFERFDARAPVRLGDHDPLDRALAELFRPGLLERDEAEISRDSAQRALSRIVRNAQIGVGISGGLDPAAGIEITGGLLGRLPKRAEPEPTGEDRFVPGHTFKHDAVEIEMVSERAGEVLVHWLGRMDDLERLRATILGTMIYRQRLREAGERAGLPADTFDAQIVISDALGDGSALLLRIDHDDPTVRDAVLSEASNGLIDRGIEPEELAALQERIVGALDRSFDRPDYWSTRLSTLAMNERSVEDLWTIRAGYRDLDERRVMEALMLGLVASPEYIIELVPAGDE